MGMYKGIWIIKLELQKLVREKMFLIFLLCCLFLNLTVIGIAFPGREYFDLIYKDYEHSGEVNEISFFEGYDVRQIGQYYYDEYYLDTHFLNRVLHWKYGEVGEAVKRLSRAGADQSIIAAEKTTQLYEAIFAVLVKGLLMEGLLLIAFVIFYLWSFENANDMGGMLYSSARGRRLVRDKMISGMIFCVCALFLLYGISLAALFIRLPYKQVWGGYVSSVYHFVVDLFLPFDKPFITWFPIKFGGYLGLSLLLSVFIYFFCFCLVWYLVAKSASVWKGIIILCAILLCPVVLSGVFASLLWWWCFSLNNLTISMLVCNSHLWFSEMGMYELVPMQEVWSLLLHLVLGAILLYRALKLFGRKEIV